MAGSSYQRKAPLIFSPFFWASLFWITAVLRFLCVPPFVIDDDEAWWSAASLAMKSPWDFYRSAVDHKPPGIVQFYWLVDHLIPSSSDPRVIRAAYTAISVLAAGVLGWIAARFARKRQEAESLALGQTLAQTLAEPHSTGSTELLGWCAGTLFLLVSAIPTPKILSVTADGLLIYLVIFAYGLALFFEFPGVCLLSGMILGMSLLIKQTAVFFALPILFAQYPRKWSWKQIATFALGSMLVVVPVMIASDVHEFFYWTWTYPSKVLTAVRERAFDSNSQMISTILIFSVATLPILWWMAVRAVRTSKTEKWKVLLDFRVLWLISGVAAAFLGKGLFLHYTLLFLPAFALLAADTLVRQRNEKRLWLGLGWVGFQYLVSCFILLIPFSGVFWGTDLNYFSQVSRVMKGSLRGGEHVMIWGGSALPLAYAGAVHSTRFVLPRFAVEPYATDRTRELFHQELEQDPPTLILDLHERGDNQFNNPIENEPFIAAKLKNYRLYISETVPWAKFYFLSPPPESSGLIEVKGEEEKKKVYAAFPAKPQTWMVLMDRIRAGAGWLEADRSLRLQASLELIARQSFSPQAIAESATLSQKLSLIPSPPGIQQVSIDWIHREVGSTMMLPLPMRSIAWWPTVAMVELQPKTFH